MIEPTREARRESSRTRIVACVAAGVVIVLGVGVRACFDGAGAKYAGVALYGALVYVLMLCVWARAGAGLLLAASIGACGD